MDDFFKPLFLIILGVFVFFGVMLWGVTVQNNIERLNSLKQQGICIQQTNNPMYCVERYR